MVIRCTVCPSMLVKSFTQNYYDRLEPYKLHQFQIIVIVEYNNTKSIRFT